MQVTEFESKGLKKNFKIVVEASEIKEAMEVELRAAGESIKIPGFRPGFIPMKVLQQRYGKSVQGDVLKKVINKATTDVVNKEKLRPALTPQINIEEYKEDGDLAFTMTLETFPEIPPLAFDKITLDRKTFDIQEKDIDEASARIAERSPKLVPVKDGGKTKVGHVVVIDFKGMIDGVAFKGGTATDFQLELGSKQFIDGFEDQLVGLKEGADTVVKVTFPKDYQGKDVAGKEAAFEVKIKEILSKEAPEIDEEFAKARGFADLRALREAIRNQMVREYDQVVRNKLKKELFDVLEEQYNFELPQGMVELEFNSIWERLQQAREQGDESVVGKDEAQLKEEYQQIAKRRVKLGLLLADVGNQNKIQISREELTRAIMQQANMYPGQEKKVMEFYKNNPDRVDDLRGPILEEKAVDFVLSKVKFNDEKVSLDSLADEDEDGDEADGNKKKKPSAAKTEKAAKPVKSDDKPGDEADSKQAEETPKKAPAKKKAAK